MEREQAREFAIAGGNFVLKLWGLPTFDVPSAGPTVDIQPLISSLDGVRASTQEIADAVRAPTRTAGEEMLDRSWTAYRNGWFDDALRDAQQSVTLYPYRAAAHLLVGLSASALGRPDVAVGGLDNAVRYAVGPELPIGASSLLLLSAMADARGASAAAVAPLEQFMARSGNAFAELDMAVHLRVPHDEARLARAVRALIDAGWDPGDGIPVAFRALSAAFDAALQAAAHQTEVRAAARARLAAASARLAACRASVVELDERARSYLHAVDGVRLGGRTTRVDDLVAGYFPGLAGRESGGAEGAHRAQLTGEVAERVSERLRSFERDRVAAPGSVAELVPLAPAFDVLAAAVSAVGELSAARAAAAELGVGAGVATGGGAVHPGSGAPSAPRLRPAFPAPLVLRASGAPTFIVLDVLTEAQRTRAQRVEVSATHSAPVLLGNLVFTVRAGSARWEVTTHWMGDTVDVAGPGGKVTRPLKVAGSASFELSAPERSFTLRVDRPAATTWLVFVDGVQVDAS